MSHKELYFGRRIRTSGAAPHGTPLFIETVETAIDQVQELPLEVAERGHWKAARAALWAAVDYPSDQTKLTAARKTFCDALEAEGWLNELKPL